MSMKHKISLALGAAVFAAMPALAAPVPYTSVLGGTVTAVVSVGTPVREGDVLLSVDSLAGPMAAARADHDGTVQEVRVQTGATVAAGAVVVIVDEK